MPWLSSDLNGAGACSGAEGCVSARDRCGPGCCGAGARNGGDLSAASMSLFTMRPLGPEPRRPERSMPPCSARRLANGDASTRPPPPCGEEVGGGGRSGEGADVDACLGALLEAALCSERPPPPAPAP